MERRQMREESRRTEGRTGHARHEDKSRRNIVWRSNGDGTWRRVVMEDDRELETLSPRLPMSPPEPSPGTARPASAQLFRPWEQSEECSELEENVAELRSSIVGSHTEVPMRIYSVDNIPSSNLQYFVKKIPHSRHENFPSTDIRTRSKSQKGENLLKYVYRFIDEHFIAVPVLCEDERISKALSLVDRLNQLSRHGGGDTSDLGIPEEVAGKSCPLCVLNCTCLGPSCLGNQGLSSPNTYFFS